MVGEPTEIYWTILLGKLDEMQHIVGNDDDSVQSFLCGACHDQNCVSDGDEIKQAFEALYEAMNGNKTLCEKDEVIYAVCRLCRGHQQTGFVDGIKLGVLLSQELNN